LHLFFYSIVSIGHADTGGLRKDDSTGHDSLLQKNGGCILKTSSLPVVGPKTHCELYVNTVTTSYHRTTDDSTCVPPAMVKQFGKGLTPRVIFCAVVVD